VTGAEPRVLVAAESTGRFADAVEVLRREGTAVTRVESGVEGLRRLSRAEGYDCVVSAPGLPEMGGVQFLGRVRETRPEAGTVLVVGRDDLDLLNRARTAGVDDVLAEAAGEDLAAAVREHAVDARLADRKRRVRRVYELATAVLADVAAANSVGDVERAVTEGLADAGLYDLVWLSEYDTETDRLIPVRAAGISVEHLGSRPRRDGVEWDGPPTVRQTGAAREVAVPLGHEGALYAVVFATTDRAVDTAEREVLDRLGTALGAALAEDREVSGLHPQVEQFGDVVAHELRNQLTLARGYLDRGREGDQAGLDRLEDALDRVEAIADEAATIASGRVDPDDLERVDLAEVAESAWTHVEPMAEETELTVEDSDTLFVNPKLMEHVFENLFQNSVTHAGGFFRGGEDSDPLQIRVGTTDDGFYFEDTGRGIPERDRHRVFDWGYTTHPEGEGIGLPLIRRFITAHDWSVRVTESEEGGARFEIRYGQ